MVARRLPVAPDAMGTSRAAWVERNPSIGQMRLQ